MINNAEFFKLILQKDYIPHYNEIAIFDSF
jgi:hypothetical protein